MKCPSCHGKSSCIDSRDWIDDTRRRRFVCRSKKCSIRFTTVEQIMATGDDLKKLPVSKDDNRLKQFNRDKKDVELTLKMADIRARVLAAFDLEVIQK